MKWAERDTDRIGEPRADGRVSPPASGAAPRPASGSGGTQRRKPAGGAAPFGHWNTSAFIAALRHDRMDVPGVFDGPVKGDIFRTCAERLRLPTLRPGDVVAIRSLGSHKSQAVRSAIPSVGGHLLFLPHTAPISA
ncbi:MAG TPA: hypothetical protein GXX24_10035 [Paracoccus solventivorans]|uniref:DDE superfamily endonuclease n=1 Tax=Paracoccus solventivorans TaxID=53463 RepID=A0A832PNU2_9RHOB|nr:hypothetical protein [Paracoccus solventivorans]